MLTPRQEFQQDRAAVKNHAEYVDDKFLRGTLNVALMEMAWRQYDGASITDAVRKSERLQGAMEFLTIWNGLAELRKATRTTIADGGLIQESNE